LRQLQEPVKVADLGGHLRAPSLFSLFLQRISSDLIAFTAEILGCGRRGGTKNSGKQRVGPLFTRCKLAKAKFAGGVCM
jgi:hypothetical protein